MEAVPYLPKAVTTVFALALLPVVASAAASVLPPAQYFYESSAGQLDVTTPNGDFVATPPNGPVSASDSFNDSATTILSAGPDPTVTTTASGLYGYSQGEIVYYLEFQSVNGSSTVPIVVTATASSSASNYAQMVINQGSAVVVFQLFAGYVGHNYHAYATNDWTGISTNCGPDALCGGSPTYYSGNNPPSTLSVTNNLAWMASTNVIYQVDISSVATGAAGFSGASYSSSIDPVFSIASSVSDPQDYSIVLSDGIGNSPASTAAPEPTSATLLFLGLGASSACLARRKLNKLVQCSPSSQDSGTSNQRPN